MLAQKGLCGGNLPTNWDSVGSTNLRFNRSTFITFQNYDVPHVLTSELFSFTQLVVKIVYFTFVLTDIQNHRNIIQEMESSCAEMIIIFCLFA